MTPSTSDSCMSIVSALRKSPTDYKMEIECEWAHESVSKPTLTVPLWVTHTARGILAYVHLLLHISPCPIPHFFCPFSTCSLPFSNLYLLLPQLLLSPTPPLPCPTSPLPAPPLPSLPYHSPSLLLPLHTCVAKVCNSRTNQVAKKFPTPTRPVMGNTGMMNMLGKMRMRGNTLRVVAR